MKKGIMAFEDLKEDLDTSPETQATDAEEASMVEVTSEDVSIENGLIELNEVAHVSSDVSKEIAQAYETADVIDEISENMARANEEEGGLNPQASNALAVVIEHFRKRAGYTARSSFPSMESFGGKMSKKAATSLAIEQNDKMAAELRQAVSVAQEGFIDNVKYKWKLFWASEKKLAKRLNDVSEKYDRNGAKEDDIAEPPFAKLFNGAGKSKVYSLDVLKFVEAYYKAFDSSELIGLVNQAAKLLNDVRREINKTNFKPDEKNLQTIHNLNMDFTNIEYGIHQLVESDRGLHITAKCEPLKPNDKKKLTKLIEDILRNKRLEDAWDSYSDAYYSLQEASRDIETLAYRRDENGQSKPDIGTAVANTGIAVANALRTDKDLARKILAKTQQSMRLVYSILHSNIEVSHASITYMAASTK